MDLLLLNASAGRARRVKEGGRDYLVAPLTSIVPGVLSGSKGPLYYPEDEVSRNVGGWDGMPLTVYHPFDPATGAHLSASDPGVVERQGIGEVRKSTYNGKLRHEGWFDAERTKAVDPRVYQSLVSGKPIELSTGLYTDNEVAPPNSRHNGRPYGHIARNYRPDHIAVLPDQQGACSVEDGCGIMVNRLTGNAGNCGVGPGGFQPGNVCAKGGGQAPDPVRSAGSVGRAIGRSLDAQQDIHAAKKEEYKASITKIFGRMSDRAANLVLQNTNQVRFHTDTDSVKRQLAKDVPSLVAKMHPKDVVPGYYHNGKKEVNLDGGAAGSQFSVEGTHAHELTHAIDGPKNTFSASQEWQKAWKSEIVGKGGLSDYAKVAPNEGFAEFGRALYAGHVDKRVLEKQYPLSSAVFKNNGLWAPSTTNSLVPSANTSNTMPDVFGKRVVYGNQHVDVLAKPAGTGTEESNTENAVPQSTLEKFVNWLVGNASPVPRGQDGKFGAGGQQQAPAQPTGKAPPLGPEDLEEGEEDEIKAKHGGGDDKGKAVLAPDDGKGVKNQFPPPVGGPSPEGVKPAIATDPGAHMASKDAATASVEHPDARDHAMKALDFSGGGKPALAAARHDKAAEEHDDAATESRKGGDEMGAQDHEHAAMLHRKASSMHSLAVRNAKKRDKGREDEDDDGYETENTVTEKTLSLNEMPPGVGDMIGDSGPTGKAAGSSANAEKEGTKEAHSQAASMHKMAAAHHDAEGNDDKADAHMAAAKFHARRGTRGNGNGNGDDMAENNGDEFNRKKTISRLTTNCPCWKDGGDVLNLMSDRQLASVARNAKAEGSNADTTGGGGSVQAGGEEDEDDHETADDHTSEDLFTDKVRIKKGKMSENRFLASLPPSYREAVVNAQEITRRERVKLVNRLIANVNGDESRRRIGARLMGKPLAELRDMLAMVPEPAYNSERGENVPLYNGAGYGGDDGTYNKGVTDDDILPLPVTNFAEISKEQRRRHRQA